MPPSKSGSRLLTLARKHVGESYVLGVVAPKNNAQWSGPWDCAEFISWLVYQTAGILYSCQTDAGNPAAADAYTGYWDRDAKALGRIITVDQAAGIAGAAVLRVAQPGAVGHIVLSDGTGGTVEAHSSKRGVIASTLTGRRWDCGILVPEITYGLNEERVTVKPPAASIYRLTDPPMKGPEVKELQRRLKQAGLDPGKLDGVFGPKTHAAVVAFQVSKGLIADGEAGAKTMKALKAKIK